MATEIQICGVQPDTTDRTQCKHRVTLDAQVQPPVGWLNTCLTRAACGGGHLRIVSTSASDGGCGDFPALNRETASCNTVAGKWAARLRAMLPLGHAENSQSTGQQTKENVRALRFNCGSAATRNQPRVIADSEPCGFLSLFHFRSDFCKRVTGSRACSTFLWGSLLFSAFSLCFNLPLSAVVSSLVV